ncbi:capsule assembly Wzi family protein [Aliidiomarina soli]|uniref:Capsule assembly Wzi family protein n=1 Tax=Aliidiomarina soli TaxID=1928574 RepID=A0A432WD70_9GAMM|nr:capsule assembly Wzi family protein [Aliidiomarina soli]RUO30346.1 hypothetical protein CWE14_13335 [Aliidiomarina soli]
MKFARNGLMAVILAGLSGSFSAHAGPWIDADDVYLRASIQQLADAGFLRGHVTTYPLMWSGIARDMSEIDVSWLTADQTLAYYRIRSALQFAQQPRVNGIKLSANSDEYRQQSFADTYRENGALQFSRTFVNAHSAARLRTSFRAGSSDGKDYAFEGSYLATTLGNWAISIDQMPIWWGPGQDSALALSTNAQPIQALRMNRLQDDPFQLPVLNWAGHWHATAFIGRTQSAGPLGDNEIAGARLTTRPFSALQLGMSYTQQWGGSGGNFAGSSGADSDVDYGQQRNQLVAADARIALPYAVALYGEVARRAGDSKQVSDAAMLFGVDHYLTFSDNLHQLFLEYADVPAYFYDDEVDPQGYRRWQASMGAGQDQDVSSISLGYRFQQADGTSWRITLRQQDFGYSNRLMAVQHAEQSTVANDMFEVNRQQLDISYQTALGETLFTLAGTFSRDEIKTRASAADNLIATTENDLTMRAAWEFRF